MWYVAGACAVVLLSAVAGLARNKPDPGQKSVTPLDVVTSSAISDFTPEALMTLSVTRVNMLLTRLENEEPPEQTMGAMCYEAMAAPEVAEYICPVCGEKTMYNYSQSAFINWELEGCRRMVESINSNTDFNIALDERLFCDFCSPDAGEEEPVIRLQVFLENGIEITNTVSVNDLRMLDSFLQGHLYYTTSNDAQLPLKNHAARMRELLGLEVE
ncbi:MAG: hypothetical protein U9P42_04925 [Candidatus Fermentibacteria bacterium]|nr:hypothetical protein [Candidatus Fermentibacteria bacterium]